MKRITDRPDHPTLSTVTQEGKSTAVAVLEGFLRSLVPPQWSEGCASITVVTSNADVTAAIQCFAAV